jgi:hypothetical protein
MKEKHIFQTVGNQADVSNKKTNTVKLGYNVIKGTQK